ncbi:DUF3152 domain-containing protein [Corynebacterium bovis]|uniref:DUF3152 domain-containing protein n=2 Tax=Corynebacterium bovis TaxID=36808 RepID=A0A8H9Y998_9CORY|nr:DUF3152 domain-containing protein [Corynebacterium bovis]MBB3115688.1 hypothetical protein [Corynebacterium bovis DSM 20582 = CIP 54.80]QQC47380.1 DUF3152 domain-containing protein [Corynebacterium bovis]RRO80624.1 DUF3152 domain-containing protein [Corynebacterium bovis]RRO85464.1 DUF3152 domain-containing protein [Corynebacterium bovis]RRQ14627.1 DUF3152 domain-containing protein [Corynebacterium bovis]
MNSRGLTWGLGVTVVLAVLTVAVGVDVLRSPHDGGDAAAPAASRTGETASTPAGRDATPSASPTSGAGASASSPSRGKLGDLPPGGPFATRSSGRYRTVGAPGDQVGRGQRKVFTYTVEVEDSLNPATYGGDDAFAAMIDATLSDPRSWSGDPAYAVRHVAATPGTDPDLRIQLTSTGTTHQLCGSQIALETSCFYTDGNRVVLNESRWVRGATTFDGDLGAYRQYVINHEVGHGIGLAAHEPCAGDGRLAPVMMQQTISLNNRQLHGVDPDEVYPDTDVTCRPNPWPHPS